MRKLKLDSRTALFDGSRIVVAPFVDLPEDLHPVWVSRSGLSAIVCTNGGWAPLPVVRTDKAFAGRLLVTVEDGDEVVLIGKEGHPKVSVVKITPQGWGDVDGVSVPIWVDGVSVHPSGLLVTQKGEFLEELPIKGSSVDPDENDDV